MKKVPLLIFTLFLAFACASVAYAAASYKDGELTVSANIAADDWRAYPIKIDGTDTGRYLNAANSSLTLYKELAPGEHKVTVENDFVGVIATYILVIPGETSEKPAVGPTVEPTAGPTATPPIQTIQATYQDGQLAVSVVFIDTAFRGYSIQIDGEETGKAVFPTSPSTTFAVELSPGNHIVTVVNDFAGKSSVEIYITPDNPCKNGHICWYGGDVVRIARPGQKGMQRFTCAVCGISRTEYFDYIHDGFTLVLPEDTTDIEAEAFRGVMARTVYLPDGCGSIGAKAFADCPMLKEVYLNKDIAFIAPDAFADSPNVQLFVPNDASIDLINMVIDNTGLKPQFY